MGAINGVHPRACGGNTFLVWIYRSITGPSPRVRGKRKQWLSHPLSIRSIPARAGETPHQRGKPHKLPVHPRACGGNNVTAVDW